MPIELFDFEVRLNGRNIIISWETGLEAGVNNFIIRKSLDGIIFQNAGEVYANGNSTTGSRYTFEDNDHPKNTRKVYYRLSTVEYSGQIEHHGVKVTELPLTDRVNVVPNPLPTTYWCP